MSRNAPAGCWQNEHGAIVVHAAVALLALLAFSAFTIDHGMLMVSRRQAQNSADAAALAAAIYLAFDAPGDHAGAQAIGVAAAQQNWVWGQSPDVTAADITVMACPPGALPAPNAFTPATCVRANVFRNQRAGGNPLPVVFASLAGVSDQGVRATATAQVVAGDTAQCVKPFAIPDKWLEAHTPDDDPIADANIYPWDPGDTFERYDAAGELLPDPVDEFVPDDGSIPGSGFALPNDYGMRLTLQLGIPGQPVVPGWFYPVTINPIEGPGGGTFQENIAGCDRTSISLSMWVAFEPGDQTAVALQGIADLIDQDPGATWNESIDNGNGTFGAVTGGCHGGGHLRDQPAHRGTARVRS